MIEALIALESQAMKWSEILNEISTLAFQEGEP